MDLRLASFDSPRIHTIQHMIDLAERSRSPSMAYVRDAKATPADVVESPNSYVFIIDVPGLKSGDIKVEVEVEEDVLVITGERKREEEKGGGGKYLRMERRVGKLMRRFVLPENVNTDKISAVCKDGVLRVTVEKVPTKKSRTVEVKVG